MKTIQTQIRYKGLLLIGDPHLEGRVPGFRKDDYPRVALDKLRWCLNYAAKENLLPAVLGDLFHLPRDNPNWMLVELMQLFDGNILGIYGNHDIHENTLNAHDSLSVVTEAGRIKLLDGDNVFRCFMGTRPVIIGGTPWGRPLPEQYEPDISHSDPAPFVVWLVHHDVASGAAERGKVKPHEIPGVDLVVNGHIHRRLPPEKKGKTEWMTPGNICRRTRSDADRLHTPSVLHVDIGTENWRRQYVEVPHRPFDEVFHEAVTDEPVEQGVSGFVMGLAELEARRTQSGEGLTYFLENNLDRFEADVAMEIRALAGEVNENG